MNPPQSVNISLYEVTVFNCTADADVINWMVNETPMDEAWKSKGFNDTAPLVRVSETQNLCWKPLTVVGSNYSNNVNISCVAITESIHNVSKPALLRVQGDNCHYKYQTRLRFLGCVMIPPQVGWVQSRTLL